MIAASNFAPDELVPILTRMNRGEEVGFSQHPGEALAFSIGKIGRSFVMRDAKGRALASSTTFSEVWLKRPRAETKTEAGKKPAPNGS